jgi:hypothetical protein
MACARCPYQAHYTLIWRDEADPEVIAVMLRCCAGPELQIRRGAERLLCELFQTPEAVLERAEQLRGQAGRTKIAHGESFPSL